MTLMTKIRGFDAQVQGYLVIVLGVVGFVFWASVFPLNQGIPGSGFLLAKIEKVPVISPMTGLVSSVEKRLGDTVVLGDVLLEFDTKPLESEERTALESIRGLETSNASLLMALRARKEQIEAIKIQYESSDKLTSAGFFSPNALAGLKSQLALAQSDTQEIQSRFDQNESRLRELRERLVAIKHALSLQKIRSPISGRVMNSSLHNPKVNITTGTLIMEIVPDSDVLVLDARLPVDYATNVFQGMNVDVMFPTIPGNSSLIFQGTLDYVSADRVIDSRTNQMYLECRISLHDDSRLKELGLRAGLPATVMVKTGPRTLLSYLVRPLSERVNKGMQ